MFHELNPFIGQLYFWLFAGAAVLCGAGLASSRHPLYGAINLIGVMLSLAGLYAILDQPFLGVVQVLTYAGAIMMLVVFVIMVLNQAVDRAVAPMDRLAVVMGLVPLSLLATLVMVLRAGPAVVDTGAVRGSPKPIAQELFDLTAAGPGYYILFELIGVILLVAIVGAIALAKRRLGRSAPAAPAAEDTHAH